MFLNKIIILRGLLCCDMMNKTQSFQGIEAPSVSESRAFLKLICDIR